MEPAQALYYKHSSYPSEPRREVENELLPSAISLQSGCDGDEYVVSRILYPQTAPEDGHAIGTGRTTFAGVRERDGGSLGRTIRVEDGEQSQGAINYITANVRALKTEIPNWVTHVPQELENGVT